MKKSLVAVMLGLIMTVSLVGCGGCGTETEESTEAEIVRVEVLDAPTEEVETEVVEEVVEEPATEVSEEVAEETPAVEEVSPYSYTELNQVMYAQSTVNVRDLPEQTGGKVGSLTTNQEVTVTGQCNETGWYRISYNGSEGFVSNSYLGTEKVAVSSGSSQSSQPEAPAPEAPSQASQPEAPAEESDTGMNILSDDVSMSEAAADNQITPDVQPGSTCGWCGAVLNSYEEAVEHLKSVHNMQ